MKISRNFDLSEFEYSETANRLKIDNRVKTKEVIDNLKALTAHVLQPLRDIVKKPVKISSGYRCPTLNSIVNGSATSQHVKGQAADIKIEGMNSYEIAQTVIQNNIDFDQLILYPTFVHVSFKGKNNRKQLLYNKSYKGRKFE